MSHRHADKTRWDKTPADYDDMKSLEKRGKSQDPSVDEWERYSGRHDRHCDQPRHGKENGTDTNGEKHKRPSGHMRGWDDRDAHYDQVGHHYRKEYKEHEGHSRHRKEHVEDEVERHKHHKGYRSKHEDGPRHSDWTSSPRLHQRNNDINGRSGYGSRGPPERDHHGKEDGKRSPDEHLMIVERGRGRERTPTLTRDESSSSSSGSSSHHGTKGSGSHSSDHSQNRDKRASERSPHTSSRRKHNRSRSGSRSSSEERERKRKKKDKRKKDKSRKRDKDKEERRSILTGKKIKLKVKKGREDHERDANRQELLQFLNAAYE